MKIHPLAVVSPDAKLGPDVTIGPFCVVEPGVTIGRGCQLASRVVVQRGTELGENNVLFDGVVLGAPPQHVQPPAEQGNVRIGSNNTFREFVTVHRAMHKGQTTTIGDQNFLMVGAHVAHDCQVGNQIIIANNTLLGGHVIVEDRACMSAAVAVHQWCRIGRLAMVGGQAHIVKDVPPYVTVDGVSHRIVGLNLIGLRRAGLTSDQIAQLKEAYRLIYRSGLKWSEVLAQLEQRYPSGPATYFREFLGSGRRGFIGERRRPAAVTLKLRRPAELDPPATTKKAG